ncbi:MAG: FtsX-like permease family protein [Vicinamibacterales bacterium]
MKAGLTAVSSLDWKLGARLLLKYPALTIIGGLSLAAAIAIGVVGIEVAGELLYKRLPFDEGSRIVRLETQDAAALRVEPRVLHDFAIWRRSLKTVAELGAARVSERNVLTGEGRVEALRVAEITASAFPLTRVTPLLGTPLQPADEMPGAEPVVVLGYDVWQRQFLHDPAIIGRVVTVGRTARTVVGVMPPRFGFPRNQQLWVPLPIQDAAPREGPAVQVFGRLADGASWQDAASELDVVSARLAADEPATHAQLRTRVRAFAGRTPGDPLRLEDLAVHAIVLLLLGAVSANVATLIFARTAMREPEIVVRHALGASRARVIAQIVTEGLVLALAAAVLGLVVAQATVRYAWALAGQSVGDSLPFWVDLRLEPATIAYALLLALVAAAMISLLPALKATGGSVLKGLQGITSTGGTMKFGGIWSFIVGAQVACTLLFVPAAVGIATNSLRYEPRWPAFPTERYLTLHLKVDNEALAGERGAPDDGQIGARRARAYEELAGRLREEPGVTHVTYGDRLPTTSPRWVAVEMEQDGAPPARLRGNFEGGFAMAAVGAGYHDAFGGTIVAGRGLHTADAGAPNGPVVVNEAFMRVVGRNPVGARVRTVQRGREREVGPWHEIVGVVTDLGMLFPADWDGAAYIYRAASPAELDPVVVAVCVAGEAAPLAPRVAALARQVDEGLQLRDIVTLEEIVAQQAPGLGQVVVGSILLVAVVFSAAGLYALMAVAVQRRTREIGIRIALGANPRRVLRTVFARAARQLGGGIIAGNSLILLLAWRADSLTAGLLVSSVITSILMAAVGVLACAAPARRALRVQPTEALRQG